MCEFLWSDPQPQLDRGPSKRGVGLSFGADVTRRFLHENNLGVVPSSICFCIMMGNKGAFIRFTALELKPDIVFFCSSSETCKHN